jgi:hypothetical protein
MSQWLHLAGIVTLDYMVQIFGPGPEVKQYFLENVPFGSEGPAVVEDHLGNTHKGAENCNYRYVAIYGDLRDRGEEQRHIDEIKDWFQKAIEACVVRKYLIRNAVLMIENEFKTTTLVRVEHGPNLSVISQTAELPYRG